MSSNSGSDSESNRSGSPPRNKAASTPPPEPGAAKYPLNSPRKSRSRSHSGSNKSRSPSGESNKSGASSRRSRSGSASSGSSRSRSGSNKSRRSSRSGTTSPNLQIDEPAGSSGSKKKVASESEEDAGKDKEEGDEEKGVSAAAIFGDDADDISSEDETKEDKQEERKESSDVEQDVERVGVDSDEEQEQRNAIPEDEEEDKENEPEPIPETRIDVEIPKISCDLGKDINFVKLPNFLSVETRPFDPDTYEDEIDEEETLDEEGRARLKLKVENTIRWRDVMDKEGNITKESNARMVKWSDGSYSLHLGSEIFDVYKQPLQGDHNHLFIRQGTGLQGQAVFRTKLSFRPHSTESFTHRKMTLSLADRSQKTSGIKILSQVGVDPDHDKATRIKKEEEKLRQIVKHTKPRFKKGDAASRSHSISNVYREEDGSDEDGAISLNAIKNKYKSGQAIQKGGAIYSSDDEGSDIESRRRKKQEKSRALKDSDTSEDSDE